MNPDDVALKYSGDRPGLDLVTYFEVGLPFFRLGLTCTLIENRSIPPIEEFVLKTMDVGLTSAKDIAGFLGLDERLLVASLSQLHVDGLIRTVAKENYALTPHGKMVLEDCVTMAAFQDSIYADYDGLTHETLFLSETDLVTPKDLKIRGIPEWPSFPADPPGVESIDLHGIRASWEKNDYHRKYGKEIISVDDITGKRFRAYLVAIALVFQSPDPSERPQIAFAIDGQLSPAHEKAFAEARGVRKEAMLKSLEQSCDSEANRLLGAQAKQALDASVIEAVRDEQEAQSQLDSILRRTRSSEVNKSTTGELRIQIEDLKMKLAEAKERVESFTARRVPVHEHRKLLRQAIETAKEQILIVSPWIRAAVIDREFVNLLKVALKRGVKIIIAYGIGIRNDDSDAIAIKALEGLRSHGEILLVRLGNTHAKVLIKDRDWVVITSFNWLSFRGDPHRPIRDERGFYCSNPNEVSGVLDDYLNQIDQALSRG